MNCLLLAMGEAGGVFVQVSNSQKTKNLFWLIFRELEGQFPSFCVPHKLELKACPIHCQKCVMAVGKNEVLLRAK